MGKVDLVRCESADALAQAAARAWLETIQPAQPHCAAFSGGRIAEKFFDVITAEVRQRKFSLAGVHFFWADERCVPPDSPESNYYLMRKRLIEPLNVPDTQVHRIKGELEPLAGAKQASVELSRLARPALDTVFLGMGEDGHIASLFPGEPLGDSPAEPYRAVFNSPKPPPQRITLAMQPMVAARSVWVLVSGVGKADALGKSLAQQGETPLAVLLERRNFTRVFSDV